MREGENKEEVIVLVADCGISDYNVSKDLKKCRLVSVDRGYPAMLVRMTG